MQNRCFRPGYSILPRPDELYLNFPTPYWERARTIHPLAVERATSTPRKNRAYVPCIRLVWVVSSTLSVREFTLEDINKGDCYVTSGTFSRIQQKLSKGANMTNDFPLAPLDFLVADLPVAGMDGPLSGAVVPKLSTFTQVQSVCLSICLSVFLCAYPTTTVWLFLLLKHIIPSSSPLAAEITSHRSGSCSHADVTARGKEAPFPDASLDPTRPFLCGLPLLLSYSSLVSPRDVGCSYRNSARARDGTTARQQPCRFHIQIDAYAASWAAVCLQAQKIAPSVARWIPAVDGQCSHKCDW